MTIDPNIQTLVKVLDSATTEFFEAMCPLPLSNGGVIFQEGSETLNNRFEIVGIISMSGKCRGAVSVHLTKSLAEKIAMTLLGLPELTDPADLFDTVGEIGNLVAGGGKTKGASAGLDFEISCPTVVKGEPFAAVEPPKGSHFAIQNYTIADCPFVVMTYLVT